jgi:hypothetical protein
MQDDSKKSHAPDPDERSKSDLMKTQGLFLIVRLLVFIAVIFIALLVIFTLLRKQAYSGSEMHTNPAVEKSHQR